MKILYVSPYPPSQDGIGTYTRGLVAAMRADGHEVCVVAPRLMPDSPEEVIGTIGSMPGHLAILRDIALKWDPDVIHVQFAIAAYGIRTFDLMRWLAMLRHDLRAPIIVTMHEVTRDTATLRAIGRAIYRRIARGSDEIIVHTNRASSALTGTIGVPAANVTVIPHPSVLPPIGESTLEDLRTRFYLSDERILLVFGFIHVDKGLGDLVRALSLLNLSATVRLENIRVVVAGSVRPRHGPFRIFEARDRLYFRWVLGQARRGSVRQHLVLTGYVPEGDIAAWFRLADAVVLPYRRTEQSGVAGLANAFGVPVLASTAGGLGEQFADYRWTYPPHDPMCLARVLADFLSSAPDECLTASRRNQSTDMATIVATTLDVYVRAQRKTTEDLPHDS